MPNEKEPIDISRRSFLKQSMVVGASAIVASEFSTAEAPKDAKEKLASKDSAGTMMGVPFERRERVRLGIIGVGGRGSSLLRDLLAVENVDIKAICDLVPEKVAHAQKAVTDAGQPEPKGFSKGDWDFKNLTQLDLDIVYIATPVSYTHLTLPTKA